MIPRRLVWLQGMAVLLLAGLTHAAILDESLGEQVVAVPLWANADPPALVATTYKPAGPGPFPLVVLSHGSPGIAAARAQMGRYRVLRNIREFVHRGFAVIVPMRRGYGDTGGAWAERYGSCAAPDFLAAGLEAGSDLLATILYAQTLPHVDASRIVLVGQSAGGFASIAAASRQPPGVIAVVNLSGGRAGNPRLSPGVPCGGELMAATLRSFARSIRVPVLWHYAENDRFFGPAQVYRWFEAFVAGGAAARLVMRPPFGSDGHGMFGSAAGLPLWTAAFDDFMASGLLVASAGEH